MYIRSMNLNREPAAIVDSAAEELRALNHRTIDLHAFQEPADVYRVVNELTRLVQYLPQAIEQAWKTLRAMEEAGAIRMDNDTDVNAEMEKAWKQLSEARRLVATGGGFLNDATQTLSHMGGQW